MWTTYVVLLVLPAAVIAEPWVLNCAGLDNGVYQYTCFSYTECVNGSKGVVGCAPNEVFSVKDGLCIIPKGDQWPCAKVKDCKHLPTQRFADVESGCRTYYTCHAGYFYGHSYCPQGTVFDEERQFCNWEGNVKAPCGSASS